MALCLRVTGACALALILLTEGIAAADKPCAPRRFPGRSVGCVCNSSYCDELSRDPPAANSFVAYTSSEAGSRFKKSCGELNSYYMWNEECSHTLVLDPATTHQTVEGFGGAVTDAVGIHWANLTAPLQAHLVNSYFGPSGIEYSMLRVPIGGSDFSTHEYAYNELPADDVQLANFSLTVEDFNYKIPLIKHIKEVATTPIHIVASTWTPPLWMKTNGKYHGPSAIKPIYFRTYAIYHAKFIREYKNNGIDIWAITTTNEPEDAHLNLDKVPNLGWTPYKMGKWITEDLGPVIKNDPDLQHVKILAVDDQRFTIPYWFNMMIEDHPGAIDWIDGVAVHWYADKVTSPDLLKSVTENFPTKFILGTEACEAAFSWQKEKVSLGNWDRAKSYITDIINDLNYNLVGWIDWNMCLDAQGGPNCAKNYVDSPVIVFPEVQEIVKQPMFYAMGHFSKFIPRGSVRIDVSEEKDLQEPALENVAFITPQNTIVLVVHNPGEARRLRVRLGGDHAVLDLEESSVTTAEFAYSPTS